MFTSWCLDHSVMCGPVSTGVAVLKMNLCLCAGISNWAAFPIRPDGTFIDAMAALILHFQLLQMFIWFCQWIFSSRENLYTTYDRVITQVLGSYLSYTHVRSNVRHRWRKEAMEEGSWSDTQQRRERSQARAGRFDDSHFTAYEICEMGARILLRCSFLLIELVRLTIKWLLQTIWVCIECAVCSRCKQRNKEMLQSQCC